MKIVVKVLLILIIGLISVRIFRTPDESYMIKEYTSVDHSVPDGEFAIRSPAFEHNGTIPMQFTCDGENTAPPLTVHNTPQEAQSLALIVDDPDTPGGAWTHWIVWNIDPEIQTITPGGVLHNAVEGMTSFGTAGYGGPCPPTGVHRYFFRVVALDTIIGLDGQKTVEDLRIAIEGHIVEEALLVGTYERR